MLLSLILGSLLLSGIYLLKKKEELKENLQSFSTISTIEKEEEYNDKMIDEEDEMQNKSKNYLPLIVKPDENKLVKEEEEEEEEEEELKVFYRMEIQNEVLFC